MNFISSKLHNKKDDHFKSLVLGIFVTSLTVIKHHDQRKPRNMGFMLAYSGGFLSVMAGSVSHGSRSRKLVHNIFNIHRKQREKTGSEVRLSSFNGHPQGHTSSRKGVKPKGLVTF